ncbi:MAG: YihY/virulence factor BrkB family protein [Candidatus Nanopelagicales bacterium]
MSATTAPPPIPGEPIDPTPKEAPKKVRELDAQGGKVSATVGVGYRALNRFSNAKASLLAAGTTYYMFLAMFALLAFGYGLAATFGSEEVSNYLTEALGEAFPGLVGANGIDPAQLKAVGQATSLIGLVGLLYGGLGAVSAASDSLHLIYGAPKDSRNFIVAKVRYAGWLVVLALMILLSFVASSFTTSISTKLASALGIQWDGPALPLQLATIVFTVAFDFAVVYLILANLGGIRPARLPLVIGSLIGMVLIELLKLLMSTLIAFTVAKPQYGALAAPIGILFVLFLQSMTLYGAASLTAGIADRDVPLEVLESSSTAEAQDAAEDAAEEITTKGT